jgi:hypothetical protein
LRFNPTHNQSDNVINLFRIQHPALLDSVPLFNTFPTASAGGMLRDEYWVPSHRRLFTIIPWHISGNSGVYKFYFFTAEIAEKAENKLIFCFSSACSAISSATGGEFMSKQ